MSTFKLVMAVVYSLILLTALFSNSLFIGTVCGKRDLQRSVFMILANQCLSDVCFLYITSFYGAEFMIGENIFLFTLRVWKSKKTIQYDVSQWFLLWDWNSIISPRIPPLNILSHRTKNGPSVLLLFLSLERRKTDICYMLFYMHRESQIWPKI